MQPGKRREPVPSLPWCLFYILMIGCWETNPTAALPPKFLLPRGEANYDDIPDKQCWQHIAGAWAWGFFFN